MLAPVWELVVTPPPLKLQRLQNKILRTIGNSPVVHIGPRFTQLSAFRVYTVINKILQATSRSQNRDNEPVREIEQGSARRTKYKRLKLRGGQI
jgi:spore coat polysaccharide biosynthesis protein SpsF (cytidylyltransferase family)